MGLMVTVSSATSDLTLSEDDAFAETVKVTVPALEEVDAKVDVYFLADTTGSMNKALAAVKSELSTILATVGGLGADVQFGVGDYKDFPAPAPGGHPYAFKHQCSLTSNRDDVKIAIDAWQTTPGRDTPEAQLYALDQLAESPDGQIGWRADSKRIIVWFGDAAGHDPVCKEISGLSYDITEASVTAKLAAETITVVALSMSTNFRAPAGLDDDPTTHAAGYKTKCGAPGGQSQQGSRIASATGGKLVQGVSADSVVQTIIGQVAAQVAAIGSLRLVATGAIAPFVSTISPTGGHGPLGGDRAHEVSFGVSWIGAVPCTNEPQVFNGSFDVVADGNVVGGETVKITVPACAEIPPEEAPVIDDNGGEVKGKERVMAEAKCMDADDLFQGFRGEFSGEAGRVGRAAGIFVGVLTGARAGSVALPIPVVGTLAGAVVGGVLGSKTGRWLGRGLIKGTAAMAGKVSSMTAHIAEGGGQPSGSQAAERL